MSLAEGFRQSSDSVTMTESEVPLVRRANLGMFMRGWVATDTNVIESSRSVSTLARSLSPRPQFKPPTPFIHPAASPNQDNVLGLRIWLQVEFLQQWKAPNSDGSFIKICLFQVRHVSSVSSTRLPMNPLFLRGVCCLSGRLENKGAARRINYLTACFNSHFPFFSKQKKPISCLSHSWLSEVWRKHNNKPRADHAPRSISILRVVHAMWS